MKLCVVGCGGMAFSTHLPAIKRYEKLNGGITLTACADIREEEAKRLSEQYAVPRYYRDYQEMLEKEKPDAAVCIVSERFVSPISCEILRQGIHTFLEKPPGKTAREVKAISEAARQSGAINMVAFNRRFAPVYTRLLELMRGETIRHIDYTFYRIGRHEPNFEDTAIHAVDTTQWLSGSSYHQVDIDYQERSDLGEKVCNYYLFCRMQNGTTATIRVIPSAGDICEGAQIHTDRRVYTAFMAHPTGSTGMGGISCVENGRVILKISGKEIEPSEDAFVYNGFYAEHAYFYDCLKRGEIPHNGADTAVASVEICNLLKERGARYQADLI